MAYDRTRITDFALALKAMDQCLEEHDERHGSEWKEKEVWEHLNHALHHATDATSKDQREPSDFLDVRSVALRAVMALEVYLREQAASHVP